MDDSSTNPYIPQESQNIRDKVSQRQSPLGRLVKWLMITTIALAVLVGGGLFFVVPLTTAVDTEARKEFANTLQPPEQTLKRVDVQSEVGFQLNYDNRLYSSYAEVGDSTAGTDESAAVLSGETYENNDLRVSRAYNYVRIRPIESVDSSRSLITQPPELEVFATTSPDDLDEAAKLEENQDLSRLSLFVKLDGDKRAEKRVADDNTVVTIEATKPDSFTINNVEYQKVRYTTTNENYRITNVKRDECYYTIQFDQPFAVCISNIRPSNVSAASLVEQVFDSIVYEQATTLPVSGNDTTSFNNTIMRLAQATDDNVEVPGDEVESTDEEVTPEATTLDTSSNVGGESDLITVTPEYYTNGDALKAFASAQPSVVRVGMLYCADLALKFEDGETATTLTDACVGRTSSGVFVSRDGYIATTGHAIRTNIKDAVNGYINFAPDRELMLDRLQRVLDYLLEAKIILDTDAEYLQTGASTGDQEALAKIMNIGQIIPDNYITAVEEEYTYAIQPSDKPIVVNRNDTFKPAFAYSDSVLKADYVASEFDTDKSVQYVFGSETPATDVGLLKTDGSFPEVMIDGSHATKANDVLSTIGFTSYTDSTLTIDNLRDMPIATISHVEQAYERDGTTLVQTDQPVLPGNDGAPVFNSEGKLIGFAVYGLLYCPDQQCFASGTVRSASELTKLINEENVSLNTGGQIASVWRDGVGQFMNANYSASTGSFGNASSYRFNRWATPLRDLSSGLQGSAKDTSLWNQLQVIMIAVTVAMVAATVILAVLNWLYKRRVSMLQTGHYGAAVDTPQTPSVAPPAPMYTPPSSSTPQTTVPGATPPQPSQPEQPAQPQTGVPPTQPPSPANPPAPSGPVEDPFYKQ